MAIVSDEILKRTAKHLLKVMEDKSISQSRRDKAALGLVQLAKSEVREAHIKVKAKTAGVGTGNANPRVAKPPKLGKKAKQMREATQVENSPWGDLLQ